jgi:hypothetical protein
MKVDRLDSLMNTLIPDKKTSANNGVGVDFQKVLAEAQTNRGGESQKLSGAGLAEKAESLLEGPLAPYSFPAISKFGKESRIRDQGLLAADQTLGILEQYQKAIADPKVSLKNLYPHIQSLSAEIQGIKQAAEGLPGSDPLKKILGEIGVLATVEVERFNRGDYVS